MDKEKEIKTFEEIYPDYCCLDLVRAKESGFVDEVVSGIFFPNKEGYCKDGVPRIEFCPFCGAEIKTEYRDSMWLWKAIHHPKP